MSRAREKEEESKSSALGKAEARKHCCSFRFVLPDLRGVCQSNLHNTHAQPRLMVSARLVT